MMKVEVVTPEEYMGDVIGDLNSRRGQVQEMSTRGNANGGCYGSFSEYVWIR